MSRKQYFPITEVSFYYLCEDLEGERLEGSESTFIFKKIFTYLLEREHETGEGQREK